MSTTIVPVADAAQFLSVIPRLLGYTPVRSLVLIPMTHGRSVGAMRVDLPPGDDPGTVEPVASTVVGMLCRLSRVDGFAAVMYSDAVVADGLPHATFAGALGRCAAASGLHLVDVLTVAGDGWGSHLDGGPPRPLSDLVTTSVVPGDQSTGADLPESAPGDRESVADALASLRASLEVLCGARPEGEPVERIDPAALAAACELSDLPRLYERALDWDAHALAPMRIALVGWCLARPALRDVALVQWSGDIVRGEDALAAQHRWEDEGAEYPPELASVMWGEGPQPEPARLERALDLCRHATASLPRAQRPGALAVCAWLSWALGRSTHAEKYAVMAHEIDPDHGLAAIVRSFATAGHLPDWAFR